MRNAFIFLSPLALVIFATGCLTTFDPDTVDLESPEPDPNPEAEVNPDPNPGAEPNPGVDPNPTMDPNPDPQPCQPDDACDPGLANTEGICDENGDCVASCTAPFDDCNGDLTADGCEANLSEDLENCTACDNDCEGDNAIWTCLATGCAIERCEDGFADVNGAVDDGCEAALVQATIDTIDPHLHGMRVSWSAPTDLGDPQSWIIEWRQPDVDNIPSDFQRVVSGDKRDAIVAPVVAEGPVEVTVTPVPEGGGMGLRSAVFQHDFTPSGWFNRSPGMFFADASFGDPLDGISVGFGGVSHLLDSGRIVIPNKLPTHQPVLALDLLRTGANAGLGVVAGFGGDAAITENFGDSWTHAPIPESFEPDVIQTAMVLPSGRIFLSGEQSVLFMSDDRGGRWERIEPPLPMQNINGMDYVQRGDEVVTYAAGTAESNQAVIFVSTDDGDTWETRALDTELPDIFPLTMLDTQRGFLGGSGRLLRTNNGWQDFETVELPELPTSTEIIRVRFDEDGVNGFVTGGNSLAYSTRDGGDSWQRERHLESLIDDTFERGDLTWPSVSHVPGNGEDAFLLMSTGGNRTLWTPAGRGIFDDIAGAFIENLVGVSIFTGSQRILAVSEQGTVLRGTRVPDTLAVINQLSVGPGGPSGEGRINAMAATPNGDFAVVVGNDRLAQFTTNQGERWLLLSTRFIPGENLVDVAITNDGSEGIIAGAVANNGPGRLYAINRDQNSITQIPETNFDPQGVFQDLGFVAVDIDNEQELVAAIGSEDNRHFLLVGRGQPGSRNWTNRRISSNNPFNDLTIQPATGMIMLAGDAGRLAMVNPETLDVDNFTIPVPPGEVNIQALNFNIIDFPLNRFHGWIVSSDGWIFNTVDGGETWVFDRASPNIDGLFKLNALTVLDDSSHAVLVGERGSALWTANGGVPIPQIFR